MYNGPERRIHRIFVTKNTEYFMRRRTCVLVRDRESGEWLKRHEALSRKAMGSVLLDDESNIVKVNAADIPNPGEMVFFQTGGTNLITSPVVAVERAPKDVVTSCYPRDDEKCELPLFV